MIVLRIKGNLKEAQQAAEERNIPLSRAVLTDDKHRNVVRAETEDHHLLSVVQWYVEPSDPKVGFGYPIGTLLFHSDLTPT